jgi:metal-responsive CopG/Arc/MetJ family transcriptional regulator
MKKITGKTKRISIIFTEDILEYFEKLSQETGATFSELIRRAIVFYMSQRKKQCPK